MLHESQSTTSEIDIVINKCSIISCMNHVHCHGSAFLLVLSEQNSQSTHSCHLKMTEFNKRYENYKSSKYVYYVYLLGSLKEEKWVDELFLTGNKAHFNFLYLKQFSAFVDWLARCLAPIWCGNFEFLGSNL
jgi:hypothetical protein